MKNKFNKFQRKQDDWFMVHKNLQFLGYQWNRYLSWLQRMKFRALQILSFSSVSIASVRYWNFDLFRYLDRISHSKSPNSKRTGNILFEEGYHFLWSEKVEGLEFLFFLDHINKIYQGSRLFVIYLQW